MGGPLRLQGTSHFSRLGIVTKLLRNHGIPEQLHKIHRSAFLFINGVDGPSQPSLRVISSCGTDGHQVAVSHKGVV